ncbi:DUF418 domain-containing protein, partial [Marivirga sp.]|uniref:DUF418 domain-containing protein n=1 Tax=Marivirga sp. TaxID=2018662 RepID=UPI0025D9FEC7
MNIKPVSTSNRIIYLDILRGLSILFIFVANSYGFAGWYAMPDEMYTQFSGGYMNTIVKKLTVVLVDGKWYSIFSILFGIGFIMQYESAKKIGKSFPIFFSKRMLGLLFFGLIHLFFFWLGDILTLYALLGFLLIFFRNMSSRKLLIWAGILLLLPIIHLLLMIGFDNFYPLSFFEPLARYLNDNNFPIAMNINEVDWLAFDQNFLNVNSWRQFFITNLGLPILRYLEILMEGRIFKVLACFLIGIWAGRMILHEGLLENKSLLKKIVLYGFLIGLPMNIVLAIAKTQAGGFWTIINYTSYAFGVVPLACAYAAGVALLLQKRHKILLLLAPVGQTAMSNYIFQTFISVIIF